MRLPERDLVRVASVRIDRMGSSHAIPRCWISVGPGGKEVEVWLGPQDQAPLLTAPIEVVTIEWPEPVMLM